MKIFGSISELVDLAFRLAGGKQVKLRSATQTTSGNLVTVNVPDVAATGDTQSMVLTAATQSISNKTLSSPTISGGTINNSIIGGSTPAAGTFTAIVGSTLDINTSAELQTLTIPSFSSAQGGILHSAPTTGVISSSKVVDADVDAAAAIAFSKLASLPSGSILIGSATNEVTAAANATASDVDLTYSAGQVTIALKSGVIVNADVNTNADIDASKIKATTVKRPIVADSTGLLKSSPTALTDGEVLYWDATNGEFKSVTGISYQEAQTLEGIDTSPGVTIQSQLGNKAALNPGTTQLLKNTNLEDTTVQIVDASDNTKAIKFNAAGNTGTATTLTSSQTSNKTITLPDVAGTLITTGDSGTVTGTMLATSAVDLTSNKVTGALPIANGGTGATSSGAARTNLGLDGMATQAPSSVNITGGTIQGVNLQNNTLNGHKLGDGAASIASSTLTPVANKSLQLIATAGNFGMIASPVAGQQYVLVNESSSDITISNLSGGTAANQIYTGTGADFTFKAKSAVSVVYDGTLSKWLLTGGGGAGGLSTAYVTAGGITAVANTHYLTNLSAAGQTITLPAGVNGSVIRFSDAGEKWDVYPLTIAPATGEKIDNLATNETLVCDVKRGWVELSYNSTFGGWALMSLASTNASASGSGEVNAVLNPSAASGTTGWTGVTQVSSGSPLDPIVTTAFSISNAAGAESSTSGGYYSIASLAPGLKSKKLQVSFYYSTPATDVYRVSVYAGSTRLALSSDSAGVTSLPANVTGGYFTATFDSTTASAYSLNITRTSGSTGACVITQVIVGPGIITQGAAISEWVSYTPTGSWSTNVNYSGWYRRTGSSMDWRGKVAAAATLSGTTQLTMTLPLNLTVTSSGLTTNGRSFLGKALVTTSSSTRRVLAFCYGSNGSNNITFEYHSQNANTDTTLNTVADVSQTTPFTMNNGDFVEGYIEGLPIAEWSGSGTVSLGAGAQVEYAWNSDVTNTASVTASGFAAGPSGVAISSNWTTNTAFTRRVRFQYPIQTDDAIGLELNINGKWAPLGEVQSNLVANGIRQGANSYGISIAPVSGSDTDFDVTFNAGGARPDNISYAGNGSTFSNFTAYSWRVRKAKASAPVGFGLAGTDGSSGLYKPGQAPGYVGGAAIPAGCVGQRLAPASETYSVSVPSNGTPTSLNTVTLTPGVWLVYGFANCPVGTLSGPQYVTLALSTNGASFATVDIVEGISQLTITGSSSAGLCISTFRYLNVGSNTTVTLCARQGATSGSSTWTDVDGRSVYAVRIA